MKKYLFIVLAAVISLFSSCAEDDAAIGLSGLKVSQSYVALPVEGGSTDLQLNRSPNGLSQVTTRPIGLPSLQLKVLKAKAKSHFLLMKLWMAVQWN